MSNKFKMPGTSQYVDTSSVDVLNIRRLPARISMLQTGIILGFQEYELKLLMRLDHLHCLGSPSPNSRKHFSSSYIQALAQNVDWLDESTTLLAKAIRQKNQPSALRNGGPPTKVKPAAVIQPTGNGGVR